MRHFKHHRNIKWNQCLSDQMNFAESTANLRKDWLAVNSRSKKCYTCIWQSRLSIYSSRTGSHRDQIGSRGQCAAEEMKDLLITGKSLWTQNGLSKHMPITFTSFAIHVQHYLYISIEIIEVSHNSPAHTATESHAVNNASSTARK